VEEFTLAFPDDSDQSPTWTKPSKGSSIMQMESSTLFALILQFGLGILAITYAVPGFVAMVMLGSILEINLFSDLLTTGYLIVWAILPIIGVLQIWTGYKFYKRVPDTLSRAKLFDIIAIALFGVDIVISAYESLLFPYPEVMMYFGANILLLILLNMKSVQDELEPRDYTQSGYQFYPS